ncbi:hypothetical protein ACOSQ2_013193 [Xanthoceras sorbifolium]
MIKEFLPTKHLNGTFRITLKTTLRNPTSQASCSPSKIPNTSALITLPYPFFQGKPKHPVLISISNNTTCNNRSLLLIPTPININLNPTLHWRLLGNQATKLG